MRYIIDHLRAMKKRDTFFWDAVQNAVAIDIQNVSDYYSFSPQSDWKVNEDLPSCMPPFDSFAMEYKLPDQVNENGKWRPCHEVERNMQLCNIVCTHSEDETTKTVVILTWTLKDQKYLRAAPFSVIYKVDKKTGQMLPLDTDTNGNQNWYKIFMNDEMMAAYKNFSQKEKEDMLNFTKPLLLAMSFMNCRNVTTVTHREAIDSKTRRRQGKPPLVKVYTLKIDAIKRMIGTHSGNDDVLTKNAFHICRGHFKDFSHGQGLFGKYKGRYWWPMTTRGSKEAGEVVKDYAVKP